MEAETMRFVDIHGPLRLQYFKKLRLDTPPTTYIIMERISSDTLSALWKHLDVAKSHKKVHIW